jgi:hypothetical protein
MKVKSCHRETKKNYKSAHVCMYKFTLTSILEGSSQVKNIGVPFLRGRPWKMLRNVDRTDLSTEVASLILGDMASSKAS